MAAATRWLPEADRIGAREEQRAQLQREILKLLIQSAKITVDGEDLPEIVETVAPPSQAVQPATMAGSLLYLFPHDMHQILVHCSWRLSEEVVVQRRHHINIDGIQYEYLRTYQRA